jgi:LDH2 family malate/lactate/ureidoglycolate dehydrogenase
MADVITSEYRLATRDGSQELRRDASSRRSASPPADAAIVADVLVAADLRGVESHGVARLESYYVSRMRNGQMDPTPDVSTIRETATSLLIDAGNGLGHPVREAHDGTAARQSRQTRAAFGAVRNRITTVSPATTR